MAKLLLKVTSFQHTHFRGPGFQKNGWDSNAVHVSRLVEGAHESMHARDTPMTREAVRLRVSKILFSL
jgi:hypothetical protein